MGFALSWIAVRGMAAEAALEKLGLRPTGRREELPESPATCARLGSGWLVVVMNGRMDAHDGTIDLAGFPREAELVTCMVEEHVMVSGCARWSGGARVFEVAHDSQQGARHLAVTGSLPSELQSVVDEAARSQDKEDAGDAEVDFFFDIPVDIADRLTGFRHDSVSDDGKSDYEVLEPVARRSWWKSLFRGG